MTDNPFGSDPFEIVFKDLMKVMSGQNELAANVAEQFAISLASDGDGALNPEPLMRIRFEALFELGLRELSASSLLSDFIVGIDTAVELVSPVEFARKALTDFSPLIKAAEQVAKSDPSTEMKPPGESIEFAGLPLAQMGSMMGPIMTGLNAGSCVGHLSREVFATYDIPVVRKDTKIQIIAANLKLFAEQWSLDFDEVCLWLCLNQISLKTILARPHIKSRIDELAKAHFGASIQFSDSLSKRLSELDISDPSTIEKLTSNPTELMGIELSSAQENQLREARSFFAVIVGLADYVTSCAARKLMGNFEPIAEALRRRRLESREGEDLFKKLFGLGYDSAAYELGHKFIFGIVERNEEAQLATIVTDISKYPTPNEVDAPGLWVARIADVT